MKHKRLRMIPEHSEYTFVYTERIFVINQYPKKTINRWKKSPRYKFKMDLKPKWF